MFTGIVAAVGQIKKIEPFDNNGGVRLQIDSGGLPMDDVAIGDSIAINGACMTVTQKTAQGFCVDVSRESLNCTAGLDAEGDAAVAESWRLDVLAPQALAKYFAYKGSVVVNGVSLTVNSVLDSQQGCTLSINLIPHTISVTTLKHLKVGSRVNLEVDLIARYVERMLSSEMLSKKV